jgi:antitoxin component of RelBE/YafQ-DinJ toxin-antitoxin module
MIDLLYLSHTVVPAHLEELAGLGLLEHDEQVLVALDGVLLDQAGQRLSGPTLHDYCLLTSLRVLLWARDYGRHLCYAFPLTELCLVDGAGLDPLHAQLHLAFAAPDEDESQHFMLTLLPMRDLQVAVTLLRLAADAARELADQGVTPQGAGPDIAALIAEQIFGSADSPSPADRPYRWPGAAANAPQPGPAFNQEFASLPPEQLYATGRLVRSAWDTLRRTIRETELPFDLNNTNFRDLAETVRALNELITTVTTNPDAREMAMAFLNRQQNNQAQADKTERSTLFRDLRPTPAPADADSAYREIPLRRRGAPSSVESPSADAPVQNSFQAAGIPLRRRGQSARPPTTAKRQPSALSGSGDADKK